MAIKDDMGFFQAVRAGIGKTTSDGTSAENTDFAIRQIVSRALASNQIIDIFDAVGLKKPDISLLSDEFMAEVRKIPQKDLAVQLLYKLMKDQVKATSRKNAVEARSFAAMLEEVITKYEKRVMTTAQVIELLIQMAQEMKRAQERGKDLGLNEAELAFYDALETNDSAVKVLGDQILVRSLWSWSRQSGRTPPSTGR